MRKVMLIVALLALLMAGCQQEQKGKMTLWGTYEIDTVGARVGYKQGPLEGGLYGGWRTASEDPPNLIGVYTLYEFPVIEVNNPIPIAWLPAKLSATPYLGGDITLDFAEDENRTARGGPLVGLKLLDAIALEARWQFVNGPLEEFYDRQETVFALCIPVPLR